ncbi:MAG: DinB family protein [Bacteroidia bacterium]
MSVLKDLFLQEIKRRLLDECIPRARKCLQLLSDDDIWFRPNENSNSMGNLVLHLNGNVRQWLMSTLGGQSDRRERQAEFDAVGGYSKAELLTCLDDLERDIRPVLDNITESDLARVWHVQGFEETGIAILVHITEHFSYHAGQMTWFVKAHKNVDTGYYAGQNLDAK